MTAAADAAAPAGSATDKQSALPSDPALGLVARDLLGTTSQAPLVRSPPRRFKDEEEEDSFSVIGIYVIPGTGPTQGAQLALFQRQVFVGTVDP